MATWSFRPLVLASALAAVFGLAALTPVARDFEHRTGLRLLFAARGPIAPPPGAVIVAIDTDTVSWLRDVAQDAAGAARAFAGCGPPDTLDALRQIRGPAGLPRWLQACLLGKLRRLGAPVVVFDVLFSVPGDPGEDGRLARALSDHGKAVILVGFGRSTVDAAGTELVVDRQLQPLKLFADSAAATGAFVLPRINGPIYGYWRKLSGFGAVESLPDEAFRLSRKPAPAPSGAAEDFGFLWHYGPAGTVPTVAMRAVLTGELTAEQAAALAKAVVFVGASDPRTVNYPDSFPSFFANRSTNEVAGVEMAATAFLNLSAGDRLRALSPPAEAALAAAILLVLATLALSRWRGAALLAAGCAALYVTAAVQSFARSALILPIAIPVLIGVPVVIFVTVLTRYRFARALTMRLAPAPVARRMLARADDRRGLAAADDATVVFCDIIGSTGIAESLAEIEFSALLNAYYDTITREVERCRGFVSSFSGDGVLAVFSRSAIGAAHPVHACHAMVAAVAAIARVNDANAALGRPALRLRVGINSGRVAAGEIGAQNRFNFSVVGDAVNLASRLEQLGKTLFPGEPDVILIGSSTRHALGGDSLTVIDCGPQSVPGRAAAEQVFRIMPG